MRMKIEWRKFTVSPQHQSEPLDFWIRMMLLHHPHLRQALNESKNMPVPDDFDGDDNGIG